MTRLPTTPPTATAALPSGPMAAAGRCGAAATRAAPAGEGTFAAQSRCCGGGVGGGDAGRRAW